MLRQEARDLARAGQAAAQKFATFTQAQVDDILKNMKDAAEKFSVCLAKAAVDETGFGKVADKAYKNHAAGALLYEEIKDEKTVGIIHEDTTKGTFDVAETCRISIRDYSFHQSNINCDFQSDGRTEIEKRDRLRTASGCS